MTTPSKAVVYFIPGLDNPVAYQNIPNSMRESIVHGVTSKPVKMIRADIAEELARALFNLCLGIEQDGELPYDAAQSALARYRNAIDTPASSL